MTSSGRAKAFVTFSSSLAPAVTDRKRSSVGFTRSVVAKYPLTTVTIAADSSTVRRCRWTNRASAGSRSARTRVCCTRDESDAGTMSSVSTPHTIMLNPINSPSCSRLGKSTTTSPRNVAAVVHMPSSMLEDGPAKAADRVVGRLSLGQRQPVRDVEQHDAVHAETEEHRRRTGRGCRQRRAGKSEEAEHDQQGKR